MSDELAQLEAERARLIELAHLNERQTQLVTNTMAVVALTITAIVALFLVGAFAAGQLSGAGFAGAAVVAALVAFVLSRQLRSGNRVAMVGDILSGVLAGPAEDPVRSKIAEYDRRIASLKSTAGQ